MTASEPLRGITGILRPFKEYLQGQGLVNGDQIVYYGCVGTCTPFVELLAVAVRGLHLEQVFVPLLDETKAKIIHNVEDVGMQVSTTDATLHPKVIVVMGGLAMPYMPVTPDQVRDLVARHGDVRLVGVCFMNMFEKAGWLDKVRFDLMIDATIDPIRVVPA
jgi:hypothetical protein